MRLLLLFKDCQVLESLLGFLHELFYVATQCKPYTSELNVIFSHIYIYVYMLLFVMHCTIRFSKAVI